MTIKFFPHYIQISLPVARALCQFASRKTWWPHLGVGLDYDPTDGFYRLAATDSFTALIFTQGHQRTANANPERFRNPPCWDRLTVEKLTSEARKAGKPHIRLTYSTRLSVTGAANLVFPKIARIIPAEGPNLRPSNDDPVGVNPQFLTHLTSVCKAVGQSTYNYRAVLTGLKGSFDPIEYRVDGPDGLTARVLIMGKRP